MKSIRKKLLIFYKMLHCRIIGLGYSLQYIKRRGNHEAFNSFGF